MVFWQNSFLSELIVNKILIVSIVINKVCSIIIIIIIIIIINYLEQNSRLLSWGAFACHCLLGHKYLSYGTCKGQRHY